MMTNISEVDSAKQFQFEEFKLLAEQGRVYFNFYLRAFALYLAIIGVILKLFLDSSPGSQASIYYFVFGLLFNIASIAITIIGGSFYKSMAKRHRDLSKAIKVADVYYPAPLKTAKMFLHLNIGFLIAWVSLRLFFH